MIVNHANGYIEEKGVNKYLIFDSTDENKVTKKYNVWNGIRDKINEVSSGESDYEKDYMKIKFNSDNNLTLNKPLKFHNMTITLRSVFEEDGFSRWYFEEESFSRLYFVWIKYIKNARIQQNWYKGLMMLIKQIYWKNVIFVTIGILKILVLSMKSISVMAVII